MDVFINPLKRNKSSDPEKVAEIKLWTRQNLPLTDDMIVSVSELDCAKPSCPKRQTVILVMSQAGPPMKMSIHKVVADVEESDVFDGCLDLLRNWPS